MSPESQANPTSRRVAVAVLALVVALLCVRLVSYCLEFGSRGLQMDFAAYYTAGQAESRGLSPYVNHVATDALLWDGVGLYHHSRFLYPPPAAHLFRPLAALPYAVAKRIWIVLTLAALGAALALAARCATRRARSVDALAVAGVTAAFFPLLALVERGQADALTLLLMIVAIGWMRRPGGGIPAGLVLALATLLKLQCAFALPFVLARRRFTTALGFALGLGALALTALAVDGPRALHDYVTQQFPRISRYGEDGPRAMRLPPETFERFAAAVGPGRTVKDGQGYEIESLEFVLNASLVRTPLGRGVWEALRDAGIQIAPAQVSWLLLAVAFALLLPWQRRLALDARTSRPLDDFIYWQAVLLVILLCAPVSWATGVVWMLPLVWIAIAALREPGRRGLAAIALCCEALLFAAIGDPWLLAATGPGGFAAWKYVAAELLALGGLVLLGLARARTAAADRA